MRAGAADYLVKDQINAANLERSIRYAIQQKQMVEERIQRIREQEARMNPVSAPPARPSEEATFATRRVSASITVLTQAELARCACPDFCERDHDRD